MVSVLIVEDDLSIAGLLEETLQGDGFLVTGVARDLSEAMDSAREHWPDCAVIDIHLANGELGTEVADELRSSSNPGVTIIFSTGNDDQILGRFAGLGVLSKPYPMSDVGRGLRIMMELDDSGRTTLTYPRQFRVIG